MSQIPGPHMPPGVGPQPRNQAPSGPKPIATLPPLPVLENHHEVSDRTGEPVRPWTVLVALILMSIAIAGVAAAYGWHWYRAVYPETYATSAHLVEWVKPAPGKTLSLILEGVLAAAAALVGGACGVAGFQGWNGHRFSRVIGIVAVALTGAFTVVLNWVALAAVIPAAVALALLFLPDTSTYFARFQQHRQRPVERYRRPDNIFYGRLPRFR